MQLEIELARWEVNNYDEFSVAFDDSMGQDFADLILKPSLCAISKVFKSSRKLRHLDLACGTGLFLLKLAQAWSTDPIGIDLSKGQIDRAKLRARREGVKARFLVSDIRTTSLPGDCDLITCNLDALNHLCDLRDWKHLILKIRKSLNPGG